MRRTLLALSLFAVATTLSASGRHGHHGMSMSIDDDDLVSNCGAVRVTFNDRPALRAEESVPVGSPRSLSIRAPQNGGVYVIGGSSGYEVTACKAAWYDEDLSQIRTRVSGNEVTADGPGGGEWTVFFIVRAPRGASLDLRTYNGPISLDGGSGTMKLNAENGPVSVRLRGTTWDGSIEAHTQNGPASLRIPAGFRSGVVVESDGHGPVSCRAAACREARRTWDDEDNRKIELGSGPTVVRMSTVNGPVSVRESDD